MFYGGVKVEGKRRWSVNHERVPRTRK
jgi:hypothetical protein